MAQQTINVGTVPNDSSADTLRTSFQKSNSNFSELYAAIAAVSGFTTGDAKLTYKTTADPGWVILNDGSIGDATSGATTRANADTQALFVLFWNNVSALIVQNSSGTTVSRGANALADYNAHRRLVLPVVLGRALVSAGAGSGLTSRPLGGGAGAEYVTPNTSTLAAHAHGDTGHIHGTPVGSLGISATALGGDYTVVALVAPNTTLNSNVASAQISSSGSSTPFDIMQPSTFINVMVKL